MILCVLKWILHQKSHRHPTTRIPNSSLGKPPCKKSAAFFNIVQKAVDSPPPLSFEQYVVNFSEGILTKLRKRLSQQLSTT